MTPHIDLDTALETIAELSLKLDLSESLITDYRSQLARAKEEIVELRKLHLEAENDLKEILIKKINVEAKHQPQGETKPKDIIGGKFGRPSGKVIITQPQGEGDEAMADSIIYDIQHSTLNYAKIKSQILQALSTKQGYTEDDMINSFVAGTEFLNNTGKPNFKEWLEQYKKGKTI